MHPPLTSSTSSITNCSYPSFAAGFCHLGELVLLLQECMHRPKGLALTSEYSPPKRKHCTTKLIASRSSTSSLENLNQQNPCSMPKRSNTQQQLAHTAALQSCSNTAIHYWHIWPCHMEDSRTCIISSNIITKAIHQAPGCCHWGAKMHTTQLHPKAGRKFCNFPHHSPAVLSQIFSQLAPTNRYTNRKDMLWHQLQQCV